ncbi:MerR family transcriptional regulator [Candidatus Dependentiae bacterium]|nr:MerR family transcriptional regulator [Candidatus Dependentiae bacterium]
MKIKRKKGHFSISAVAKMFSVHQQTIRLYEKEGFICPKRSAGNTRLFSEEDVDRLEEIIYLTHQMGINLAGVEMILKLKKQIKLMQKNINKLFEQANQQLEKQTEVTKQAARDNAQKLLQLKNETNRNHDTKQSQIFDVDNWEIEYDED